MYQNYYYYYYYYYYFLQKSTENIRKVHVHFCKHRSTVSEPHIVTDQSETPRFSRHGINKASQDQLEYTSSSNKKKLKLKLKYDKNEALVYLFVV